MLIEITQIFTRNSIDIPWFQDTLPESHYEYIRTTYAGKVQGKRETLADGLMLSINFSFVDADAQHEFMADTYLTDMVAKRDLYNLEHDITQLS